ncbi:MAG TPA: hypothetical protein PLE45_03605 [Spirochaetota bacterium]|nr:hypothetical protein [Spirochaetota bacterium]HOL56334.1 hypothetical protein [Spirochaetota bacterium]HPP03549.1 hypothetical protein [Spirochaetota bacterium]
MLRKRIIILILIINLFLICCQCSNQGWFYTIPKFDPIEVNENTIFGVVSNYRKDKILVIDVEKEKIIYTYDLSSFSERGFFDVFYDLSLDSNIYFTSLDRHFYKLDTKKGELKRIALPQGYEAEYIAQIEDKLLLSYTNYIGKYVLYSLKTNSIEYIDLPGFFTGECMYLNGKYYLEFEGYPYNYLYNYTDKKILSTNLLGKGYWRYCLNPLKLDNGNYLSCWYNDENEYIDFYYITSLEPPTFIHIQRELDERIGLAYAYERGNFVYFFIGTNKFSVVKRDKANNYAEVKSILQNTQALSIFHSSIRPPYIWMGSTDGVYKINMDDLSYKLIR